MKEMVLTKFILVFVVMGGIWAEEKESVAEKIMKKIGEYNFNSKLNYFNHFIQLASAFEKSVIRGNENNISP